MTNETAEPQVQFANLEIAKIRVNPGLRGVYEDSEEFAGLCKSVKARGVLVPIEVRVAQGEDADGFYDLCDGGHRLAAAVKAGHTTIPVTIKDLSDADIEEHQLELNLHKVGTKAIDYTKQLVKMLGRNPLMTRKELAEKVNASESFVDGRLGLLKLPEEIQKLVNEGDIPVTSAQELARLPKDEMVDWLQDAIALKPGEFVPKVKDRLSAIRKANREGKAAEPATFSPTAKTRSKADLVARYEASKGKEKDVLAWVLQLDDESVTAAEADYNAKKKEREEKAAKRKAEREAKAAEEAAAKAADAQAAVDKMLGLEDEDDE